MERNPRSNGKRVTLMMVLIILTSGLGAILGLLGGPDAISLVVPAVIYAFLATRVSLPWYYIGWFLVPIAGIYAVFKISWRVAYLPWRDWDLRLGEAKSPYDIHPNPEAKRREGMVQVRTD